MTAAQNFFEGGAASSSEDDSDEDDYEGCVRGGARRGADLVLTNPRRPTHSEEERRAAQAAPVRPRAAAAHKKLAVVCSTLRVMLPQPPPASGLPSVSELFSAVDGPPAFLRPDATRPIAVIETHPHATAPPLHPVLGGGDRRADAAVIGAAPQRYSAEEAAKREALSALRREAEAAEAALAQTQAAEAAAAAAPRRDFRSKAVPVSDALANPSLNLPRDKQERKDRERAKRERGQSAIGSWKSEAEMVLRQQYDS